MPRLPVTPLVLRDAKQREALLGRVRSMCRGFQRAYIILEERAKKDINLVVPQMYGKTCRLVFGDIGCMRIPTCCYTRT